MKSLGVGIIGTGWVAGSHIEAFEANPETGIRAILSRDKERAHAYAETHGLTRARGNAFGPKMAAFPLVVAGCQHVVESADSGLGENQLEPRKLFRDAGEYKMRNDLRRRDRRGAGRCRMGLPG